MAHGQGGAEIGIDRGPTLTCNHEAPIAVYPSTTHTLRGEGFDASEDGTGRGTPLVPVAFHPTQDPISSTDGSTHALSCGSTGGQASVAVAQPIPLDLRNAGRDPEKYDEVNRQGVGVGDAGDPAHTVTSAFVHGVAVAQSVGFDSYNHAVTGDVSKTLDVGQDYHHVPNLFQGMAVRRLTPIECERLQGFPDNYTAIPWRQKPVSECPDGPRYKALGNSWAVPVVRWIGSRIKLSLSDENSAML